MKKKYQIIYADPPWAYRNMGNIQATANAQYPTMSNEDICKLPIADIADENSILFLWATFPKLQEALDVIKAWGFEYKTVAWTWVKLQKAGMGFHFGLGYYTRANTEPCLLAVRGKMPVAVHDVQALICSPVREHSRKPDDQYGKIERLYPDATKLEMFARRQRSGWDVFGNEVENSISLFTKIQ